ncbi:MAG TPA: alpha-L-fucosidase [Terriglobia bacterium]|nr:alpha-L-fucosidase [Terriglobia bacterium]
MTEAYESGIFSKEPSSIFGRFQIAHGQMVRWMLFQICMLVLSVVLPVAYSAAGPQSGLNKAPWYKPPQLFVMTGFIANTTDGVWGPDFIVNGEWTPEKQQLALADWRKGLGEDYNADEVIREFKDAGATGVIFYDKWHDGLVHHATRLTGFKTQRDFVKETLEAIRRNHMAAVVYYSVGLDDNPDPRFRDWTCLDAQGNPMGLAFSGDWKSFYSPYRQYVMDQLSEVVKNDGPIDGLWLDLYTQPSPISYDQYTLSEFKEHDGILPRQASDRQKSEFDLETLRGFLMQLRQSLHKVQPNLSFTYNGAGMDDVVNPEKAHLTDSLVDWFSVEGHVWPQIDRDSRVLHAADRPFEVAMLINSSWYVPMSRQAPPPSMSEDEAVVDAATAWIEGGNVYAAMTPGHSGIFNKDGDLRVLGAMGDWLKQNRSWLVGAKPYAEIGVLTGDPASDLISIPTLGELWKASHRFKVVDTDAQPGFDTARALRKMGYLTERVGGTFASHKFDLGSYRMLLVPETALLNKNEIEEIREYVRQGGTLLAFGHASLFDPDGHPRKNFGLSDVFGADYAGSLPGYKLLAFEPGSELASGLSLNPGALAVRYSTGRVLARWKYAGNTPAIIENIFGKGKCIYVSAEETAIGEGRALLEELVGRLIGTPAFTVQGSRHYVLMVNRKNKDLLCYLLNRDTPAPTYVGGRRSEAAALPRLSTREPVRLIINTSIISGIKSAHPIPSKGALLVSRRKGSVELYFNASPSVTTLRLTPE